MSDLQTEIQDWMAWEGALDVVAFSSPELSQPDVIIHVARVVHTPRGNAASGMILLPNFDAPEEAPLLMGFVSGDENVGAYFGPHLFAGTPFENAPLHIARIEVENSGVSAAARVQVGALNLEIHLLHLGPTHRIEREPGALPFAQNGLESQASRVELSINGAAHTVMVPTVGITGGPAAVFSPCGLYTR